MRKLVTIRKINNILPIKGKDLIALAIIDGWSVIVKKSEFNIGDLCVFFEIDSFLPNVEPFLFLGKFTSYKGKEGFRLKTMKMAGVLSQGLALPLSMFPTLDLKKEDLAKELNVIKYDIEETIRGTSTSANPKGTFPSFIPKTDQNRLQNLPHYFTTLAEETFEETLKLDGSSMTCYKIPKQQSLWDKFLSLFGIKYKTYYFGVCSRNLEVKDGNSNFWNTARKYNLEQELPEGYAVQGELIAPNIQSNHEKVTEPEYYIFDIYDIKAKKYLLPAERVGFMKINLPSAKHIPVVESSVKILKNDLQTLLKRVEGSSINPKTVSEGRVYKSTTNPTISFKVISNQYLLKSER